MRLTVKLGGIAGAHAAGLAALVEAATSDWVIVHGGGSEIAAWSDRLGLQPRIVDGLRVTDAATLDVVTAVLRGLLNARLVASFAAAGSPAIGISGADGGLFSAIQDHRLGFVGHVTDVNVALLDRLCADGLLPIVAPIAAAAHGQLLNINADEAAGAVAAARGGRLLLLTDVAGVERHGRLVLTLDLGEARAMLADGSAGGGMRPKLRAAITAAEASCDVQILDGRSPDAVREALGGAAVGTQVLKTAGVAPVAGGQS